MIPAVFTFKESLLISILELSTFTFNVKESPSETSPPLERPLPPEIVKELCDSLPFVMYPANLSFEINPAS